MRPQAKQFIELLVSKQLLAPEIVEELNRQVAESKNKLSPELIAKLLVDNGHLTKFQATQLIAEVRDADPAAAAESTDSSDELGFADEEDTSPEPGVAEVFIDDEPEIVDVVASDEVSDAVEVEAVEVIEGAEVVDVAEVVEVAEAEEVAEVVEVVEAYEEADVVEDEPESVDFGTGTPARAKRPAKAKQPEKSAFDSFRILGVGLILTLVVIALVLLVRHFVIGNADDMLAAAKESYEGRQYQQAADLYSQFPDSFPTHEKASFARVRAALSQLRQDSENVPNPAVGLETALAVLPPIEQESALTEAEQRSDLAGILIGLADKFTDRADDEDDTAKREELMAQMDQLVDLINNPQFVGKAQRDQQAPTLQRVFESRKRILREIGRDKELATTLAEMDQLLAQKDVPGAYAARKELVAKYPLLQTDDQLMRRVAQASTIQQALVQPSEMNAEVVQEPIAPEVGRRVVLANQSGNSVQDLAGRVITIRAKGSIYGIDGETGKVLWRRFVGREFKSSPIALTSDPGADILVTSPAQGLVSRLAAKTGDVAWSVQLGRPAHSPVVESEEVFVSTFDGSIISLDAVGGQTRWATRLPQPIAVRPAVAFGRPNLYVPAEHSNLYVVTRADGACRQVWYLDNREGSIAVPPILFRGQLFVFENLTTKTANIRIFDTDENGLITSESQSPIAIAGNVVVQPLIDSRRLIVQSDLGAIKILNVEPTLETKKVSLLASVPPNAPEPTTSYAIADRNKLWVADDRLSRFDLQLTQQKLNRTWVTNEGDTFTGPMQKHGDAIIHSRRLRGNLGVRVAAVSAEDGGEIWTVDIGVPVTYVAQESPGAVDVVNAAGMLFAYKGGTVMNKATANPGGSKPDTVFDDPVRFPSGTTVMLNRSRSSQMAVYLPERRSLRVLTVGLGSARPSCPPVSVGDSLGVGLANGQFVLVDPSSGSMQGAPYQPELEPGQKVVWNAPVYLPEAKTLVIASSLSKMARLSASGSLRTLSEVDLESPLAGPLCRVGDSVCGVLPSTTGDSLVLFDSKNLKASPPQSLPGRWMAGPFPVEGGCLVQTDAGVSMFDESASLLWTTKCGSSQIVGKPIPSNGKLLVALRSGQLFVLSADSGDITGSLDTRQDFTSAPALVNRGLLVGSDEGAVMALQIPTKVEAE
ncbi:MAG: PQQ-binding-like beta-propeller repeat protein [Aureliella sp.]